MQIRQQQQKMYEMWDIVHATQILRPPIKCTNVSAGRVYTKFMISDVICQPPPALSLAQKRCWEEGGKCIWISIRFGPDLFFLAGYPAGLSGMPSRIIRFFSCLIPDIRPDNPALPRISGPTLDLNYLNIKQLQKGVPKKFVRRVAPTQNA